MFTRPPYVRGLSLSSRDCLARHILVSLLAIVACASVALSDDANSVTSITPQETEIREQVLRLGATKYRDRKRAEATLRKMGSAAIEVLQENTSHENLEIKIRVKRLIGNLRSRFIQQTVPEELSEQFRGYEDMSFAVRKAKLEYLGERNLAGRIRLLSCLARFEESDLLAKHAALIVLNSKLKNHPDGVDIARKEMLEGIELSRRPSAEWIRLYAHVDQDAAEVVDAFHKVVEKERSDLKRFDKGTEQEIVTQLSRFVVKLQIDRDMRQNAIDELEGIIQQRQLSAAEAMEFWDWLEGMEVPEAFELFREQNRDLFEKDAVLLYRLAKAYEMQGDKQTGRELADKAFASAGGNIAIHIPHYRESVGLVSLGYDGTTSDLEKQLVQNPDDETARRYLMAVLLDDQIGQLAWAEKEYLAATGQSETNKEADVAIDDGGENEKGEEGEEKGGNEDEEEGEGDEEGDEDGGDEEEKDDEGDEGKAKEDKPEPMNPFVARARYNFAEMLHDQQREKEAALQLQPVVDYCETITDGEVETLLNRKLRGFKSRMHYFYASDAAMREEHDEQRKHLIRGINSYDEDIDVLIGMHRSKAAPEQWTKDTKKRIEDVIQSFEKGLRDARRDEKSATNPRIKTLYSKRLAFLENQYAWLVSNTIGDIEAAIKASEHSLEVYPGDGGHLDTLGRCYYRKGDFKSAIKYQRMAAKAAPHELQIQRQLQLFESEAPVDSDN